MLNAHLQLAKSMLFFFLVSVLSLKNTKPIQEKNSHVIYNNERCTATV
jgi:hypothetical protein